MKKLMPILIILLITIFISCNNSMGSDAAVSPDEAEGAYLLTDTSKGVVFVDETGAETVVKSVENGETVVCKEVIDYKLLNEEENLSKSSVKTVGRKRAVILGYRDDGFPGLWIVYSGGIVRPVVNSEDIETSELLEMAEARQPLFKHFGWTYKALDMAVNGNEIIIAGYAENEDGIPLLGIDPGTTIGMYWSVIEDEDGYYHISRAKVVGYKDNDWWKRYRNEIKKPGYRYRWRWLHSLRLFFFGWYDKYLTMTESVEVGENPGEFEIKGTDDEGTDSVATVTAWKVLSIEEAPDDPNPNPSDPAGMVFSSNRDGDFEIYSLDPDTGITVQLTDNDSIDKHPDLSKDGTKIVFVSDKSGSWGIYTMKLDDKAVVGPIASLNTADDGHPSWNPDGTRIAYSNNKGIYTMDSDGGNSSGPLVTLTNSSDGHPAWNPKEDIIAYHNDKGIYTMNTDGTNLSTALAALINSNDGHPAWNSEGTKIVYDNNYEIFTMNSDGTSKDNLTDTIFENESNPAWSPDGDYVAYVKNEEIFIKNSDGSGSETNLTNNTFSDQDPSW